MILMAIILNQDYCKNCKIIMKMKQAATAADDSDRMRKVFESKAAGVRPLLLLMLLLLLLFLLSRVLMSLLFVFLILSLKWKLLESKAAGVRSLLLMLLLLLLLTLLI